MEAPTGYLSIPNSSPDIHAALANQPPLFPFPTTRRSLFKLLVIAASTAIIVGTTAYVTHVNTKESLLRYLPVETVQSYSLVNHASFPHMELTRESDAVVEERIPTSDCGAGLHCRARIIITSQSGHVTVQAGYLVTSASRVQLFVDNWTKSQIAQVTAGYSASCS